MTLHHITAERSGRWWVLQSAEAPGAISQVARLDQAEQIKEAIAFVTGEPEESIEIEVRPRLSAEARSALLQAERLRESAAEAALRESSSRRFIAKYLTTREGLALRDAGQVLGVSHQRAHQLANEATDEAWARLSVSAKEWLALHPREPVPDAVWSELEVARFVAWWGREEPDGTRSLERQAWDYIEPRAAQLQH